MGNFVTIFLLGLCFLSINLLFISIAGLLRYFPQALAGAGRIATYALRLSVQVYEALLLRLGPLLWRTLHFEISQGWGRVVSVLILSLLLALGLFLVLGQRFGWTLMLFGLLHGIGVNLIWDQVRFADSLRMGEEV